MQKKTLFFAGAVLCLFAAGWGWYQYQRPRADTAELAPDFKLTAAQLFQEYSRDEVAADKKFSNKILEITGEVEEVQNSTQSQNILLSGGEESGGVNCSLRQPYVIKTGNVITVKGRCTGFLMDVNLADGVLSKK